MFQNPHNNTKPVSDSIDTSKPEPDPEKAEVEMIEKPLSLENIGIDAQE